MAVLSYDHQNLFIKSGDKLGRYKASLPSGKSNSSAQGHLLAPDGRAIVVPFDLTYVSGDDVLSGIRVIRLDGDYFSWRGDYQLAADI